MISVIIPYKNAAGWIERCVNSLLIQGGDLEFIMVNDGSEDKGEAIARKAAGKDDRFVFVQNTYSPGVSGARNQGIASSEGEWLTFLDADDELHPEASKVFERMTRLPGEPNIIQSNQLRYYEKSGKTRLRWCNEKGIYSLDNLPIFWCMVWNKLYRTSFIKEHDIRFKEGMQFGEDEIFNLHCLLHDNRIIHTQKNTVTTIHHFDNKESLSHIKNRKELLGQVHALEEFIEECEDPEIRQGVCRILSEHWGSKTYLSIFGEGK